MTDTDDRVERVALAISLIRRGEGDYYSAHDEALARAALAAADQWEPIETAPRDGSSILVADARGRVHEANWQNDWYGDESNPGWMPANLDEEYGSYIAAVAWMPMPRAPEAK